MNPTQPKYSIGISVRTGLVRLAMLTAIAAADAAEQTLNPPGTTDITVGPGDTVSFDSGNTNNPVPLATVNTVTPATGFLPGWGFTFWDFVKYDGANVVAIPAGEKVVGAANLASATAASDYYDGMAATTLATDQTIGLVETTRDFLISNGSTLNIALGGLMYHNANHWVKVGTGSGFVTSSSGQLVIVTNGGGTDYQLNGIVAKDFDESTPLRLVKTGGDHLGITAANTYTGGTWVNNGRLRATNVSAYGAAGGTVKVSGTNAQACLAATGTFNYNFELAGLGWSEGALKRGAMRLEANATVNGNITLTGASRIAINTANTGTLSGTLSGSDALELGLTGDGTARSGTLILNGSGAGMTGPVTVTTGRLNLNSDLGGNVTVSQEANLGGEGSIAGNLTMGGAIASGLIADGNTPAALAVAGQVDLSAGTTNISVSNLPASPATSFTAFTYGTLVGPVGNLTATGLRGGVASDDAVNSRVIVSYTPGNLTWTGATNANWTRNADLNFDDGGATSFFNGDQVSFTEAAATKTVTMVGSLLPSGVSFDHSSDYTLLGTGAGIAGPAGITKNGSGTLNLYGETSTFTGPIAVNAGILKYGTHYQAFGFSSGVTIANGAQVDINGNFANNTGRRYTYTIAGSGPDGNGAITNSNGTSPNQGAGINSLVLTADASVGGNAGRFDIGVPGFNPTITGNGHTLTKVGGSSIGYRADASATPIDFVVAGGLAWAENTNNAWGGATGTLRVKAGAKGGTYGALTIATPVFLEAGATLHNQGGGVGTWDGDVTLEGDATIEAGTEIQIFGAVTGAFSLTKTGGAVAYLADPQYTGNTTVSAGTLSLGFETLSDSSTVSISGTGVLDLIHGATDVVDMLVIDGIGLPSGTYGSSASGATNVDDVHFTGDGMLSVTSDGDAYLSWEGANGIAGAGADADSDLDGIENGIEFVIGGDPSGPGSDSNGLLVPATTDATYLNFVFRRTDESAPYGPYVQYGSDLSGWTTAVPGEPVLNPVIIDEVNDDFGAGVDRVTVRIPRALATGDKIFARLRIDIP
ncbi:beta strand repeat-containing protein [Luteolibacter marinus]|uniref:beta strand repeat-containing protein n=1 Tax=Luteolibacter marinus TaxID=2776705 RepID=UPI00186775EE|nr:autotransporter-associated beta strand repeat-containing protein [Luteolibacter marinus]